MTNLTLINAAKGGDNERNNIQTEVQHMLNIKEAATMFRMSEYAIRKGIREGMLPAAQLSGTKGQYLIEPESFRNALKELCVSNIRASLDTGNRERTNNIVNLNTKIRRIQG